MSIQEDPKDELNNKRTFCNSLMEFFNGELTIGLANSSGEFLVIHSGFLIDSRHSKNENRGEVVGGYLLESDVNFKYF